MEVRKIDLMHQMFGTADGKCGECDHLVEEGRKMMVMLNAEDIVIPMACSVCDAYIHEIGENPKCRYIREIMRWYNFDPKRHRMYKCPYNGIFEERGADDGN